MPRLSRMLGPTAELTIPIDGDEPLIVTYRRAALTPRLQARLADLQRAFAATAGDDAALPPSGEQQYALCELYARLIVGWNLTDDDGEVIPTDAESLADVDYATLSMVSQAIASETQADPLSGSGSSNGSSPTADSGPRLITTAS
jgi:hypothetical protein